MVKLFGDGEVVRSVDVEPTVVEPVAANDAPLVVVEPVVVAPSSVEPVVVTPVVVAAYTGPVDPNQELVVVQARGSSLLRAGSALWSKVPSVASAVSSAASAASALWSADEPAAAEATEVAYVDTDGDSIVFKRKSDGTVDYWVNGELEIEAISEDLLQQRHRQAPSDEVRASWREHHDAEGAFRLRGCDGAVALNGGKTKAEEPAGPAAVITIPEADSAAKRNRDWALEHPAKEVSASMEDLFARAVAAGLTSETAVITMRSNIAAGYFSEQHYRNMWSKRLGDEQKQEDEQKSAPVSQYEARARRLQEQEDEQKSEEGRRKLLELSELAR